MRPAVLAALLLAALVAGCGGASSPSPEDVTSAAVSGLSKGDEKKVCAQLTEPAQKKLLVVLADDPPIVGTIRAATCEEAIVKVHARLSKPIRAVLEDGEVDKAKITGDKAMVHVTGAGTDVELEKTAGEWKIVDGLFKR